MAAYLTWDFDPLLIHIWGPLQIRWYGFIFVCTLIGAFMLWRWQMRRGGFSRDAIEGFIVWGALATIVGARLGHCFFYNILPHWMEGNLLASPYVQNPLRLLAFWEGGLASHGATLGLLVALWLYARRCQIPLLEVLDRFSPSAAAGAAGIRLGNFLNSEIVGRVTDVPWAVKFVRYEDHEQFARHPSQLYEFSMGLLVLAIVCLVDRLAGREKRPKGLLVGLFLLLYFTGRFCVEFVKEYQAFGRAESLLTMGQYLSIIPMVIGAVLVMWSLMKGVPTRIEGQLIPGTPAATGKQAPAAKTQPQPSAKKRRNRQKRK